MRAGVHKWLLITSKFFHPHNMQWRPNVRQVPLKTVRKRKKRLITIEDKKETIEKYEKGVRVSQLACEYGRNLHNLHHFEEKGRN